jgi:hypothetical protein
MSPYISRFIVDGNDTIYTLHFILVETVAVQDVWVVVPVGWNFFYCEESFGAVLDGCGELIESLFGEITTGVEGGIYVFYRVDIGDTIVCVCFEF